MKQKARPKPTKLCRKRNKRTESFRTIRENTKSRKTLSRVSGSNNREKRKPVKIALDSRKSEK